MKSLQIILITFFTPASMGLLWQTFTNDILSAQLLYFAFFLFSLEQISTAFIDLSSYFQEKTQDRYSQLSIFLSIVIITIIIELFGFYFALLSLGWGSIIVLISQFFFNLFAPLKVIPNQDKIILQSYSLSDKLSLLLVDSIVILLITLWFNNIYPLFIGFFILLIMLIFMMIKYKNFLIKFYLN